MFYDDNDCHFQELNMINSETAFSEDLAHPYLVSADRPLNPGFCMIEIVNRDLRAR